MKNSKQIFLILFLTIILVYITVIFNIPKNIIILEGEEINLNTILGIYINKNEDVYSTVQTSSNINNKVTTATANVTLLNFIKIKELEVNTIPKITVIPLGNIIGLKLYASGVLVVGMTEIGGEKPYENTKIKEGDMITKVNDKAVTCTADLIQFVNESMGNTINITYTKNGESFSENIKPVETSNNEYKLGLWVRDGAAGIGTITYYEPETKQFAALGHGITDMDTKELVRIASGEVVTTTVSSIQKGEKENPGQIKGGIVNGKSLGTISNNTDFGIYGKLDTTTTLNVNQNNALQVATREEIEKGPAKLIITLEDGIRKEYDIEISKIYKTNNSNNKSMLIKVTDNTLLNLTGGIIQGMSGAPIVQNGKFIRCYNTCISFRSNNRICSIWRFNDKRNARSKMSLNRLQMQ